MITDLSGIILLEATDENINIQKFKPGVYLCKYNNICVKLIKY